MVMNSTSAVAVIIHAVSPEFSSPARARAGAANSAPATPIRRMGEGRRARVPSGRPHVFAAAVSASAAGPCVPAEVVSIVVVSCVIGVPPPEVSWIRGRRTA